MSTAEQSTDAQAAELTAAGVERVRSEIASGAAERVELARVVAELRTGDRLTVTRLDRLGRSLSHLVATVTELRERGIHVRSLAEAFDTSTAAGRLQLHLVAAFAEFERELIRERTHAGLAAARARGRCGGRPRALNARQRSQARALYKSGSTLAEVAQTFGVSASTVRRAL